MTSVKGLNPYCSGRWSRTTPTVHKFAVKTGLNPYCSGRWSRTMQCLTASLVVLIVLILIVVEDGLVLDLIRHY